MSEVGVEIVKTEETKESGIKYFNINVSNNEVERNPDVVRLHSDVGTLEYVKPVCFTTRKEQRKVNEVVSAILLPLIPHLKEDEADAVQIAITILQEVEVESEE